MQIQAVNAESSSSVASFLRQYDYQCASLTDYFIRKRADTFFYVLHEQGKICGVFSYSTGGVVLFCLPYPQYYEAAKDLLIAFFRGKNLFCLNGSEPAASFMKCVLQQAACSYCREVCSYYLMVRSYRQPITGLLALSDGYQVRQCSLDDLDILFPLEEGFQREEVWLKDQYYDVSVGKRLFAKVLQTYPVYAIEQHGVGMYAHSTRFVAKAAINAMGYTCGQLGGVYTAPAARRCGFSGIVISTIIKNLASQHRDAVLFVKQKNTAAFNLYKKLGFTLKNNYMIAYW